MAQQSETRTNRQKDADHHEQNGFNSSSSVSDEQTTTATVRLEHTSTSNIPPDSTEPITLRPGLDEPVLANQSFVHQNTHTANGAKEEDLVDETVDVDSSSDGEDNEEESLLSGPQWRDEWSVDDDDDDDDQSHCHRDRRLFPRERAMLLRAKWEEYQLVFAKRDDLLRRISGGRNDNQRKRQAAKFLQQIKERERLVRYQTCQDLLREALDIKRKVNDRNASDAAILIFCKEFCATMERELEIMPMRPRKQSFASNLWNDLSKGWVFEMNSFVPSVFAMLVHTIALNCLYDGLDSSLDFIKKKFVSHESRRLDLAFTGVPLALGIFCMRCTGDLYWWLSDRDYDLVKFDFHNRRYLRYWDARVLQIFRGRLTLRSVLFVIGYHFCYAPMTGLLFWVEKSMDQSKEIMAGLPSRRFENDNGMCYAALAESFCLRSCQDEIFRREQEFLTLKQSDMEYTSSLLTSHSQEVMSHYWAHNDGTFLAETPVPALYTSPRHIFYCATMTILSIFLLTLYGFRFCLVELVLLVTQKLSLLNGFAKRLCFSKWDELTQNTVFSYSDSVKSILRNDAGHTPKKIRYTAYKYKDTDSRRAKIASSKTPVTIGCIKDGDENAKKVTTAMCRALSCTISQHK